tara:strand:+ start:193 stop:372 length:180 start_codon:yes stop_codon:yes gene_type:complete
MRATTKQTNLNRNCNLPALFITGAVADEKFAAYSEPWQNFTRDLLAAFWAKALIISVLA